MKYKIGLFFLFIASLITTIGCGILIFFLVHFPALCGFGGYDGAGFLILVLIALVLSAILLFIVIISWVIFRKIILKKAEWSIGLLIIGTITPIVMVMFQVKVPAFYFLTVPHLIAFALLKEED